MGKYDGYLLATDFDETLAVKSQVSRENVLAIRHFQENGGLFTIASGRIPIFLAQCWDQFRPNAPLICTNGTLIYDFDTMELLHSMTFGDDIDDFVRFLFTEQKQIRHLLVSGVGDRRLWQVLSDKDSALEKYYEAVPKPWCRLLIDQPPEDAVRMRAMIAERYADRYDSGRSWDAGLEIIPHGSGKGACLKWIKRYLGDRVHTTVGVGDYENDLTMIRDADIGYAVGNALDECKAAADRVTVTCQEHAIARIIDEIG